MKKAWIGLLMGILPLLCVGQGNPAYRTGQGSGYAHARIAVPSCQCAAALVASPQPASQFVTIHHLQPTDEWISIYTPAGRQVASMKANGETLRLNTEPWPAGTYVLRTRAGRVLRIVKL